MKANIIFVAATLALTFAAGAVNLTEPITVSNVRFSQDRATQRVTVNYELANQGEPAWVTMDVLTNGVSIGMQNIAGRWPTTVWRRRFCGTPTGTGTATSGAT